MIFTTTNQKALSSDHLDTNVYTVFLSDAEATVIENKAKKAGLSINEYLRNTALGFPVG